MFKIAALEKLTHELSRFPGIGQKTASRLAYFVLRSPGFSQQLQSALQKVEEQVKPCPQCFSYTDSGELCHYCADSMRRNDILCVVEEPVDILRIESSGAFRGRYHVLHGAISPLDRISPDDLKIKELIERIDKGLKDSELKVREIILALDQDLEGDTTVLYLSKILANKEVKLSRLASGVPIGGDIEYVDDRTLSRALENRIEL